MAPSAFSSNFAREEQSAICCSFVMMQRGATSYRLLDAAIQDVVMLPVLRLSLSRRGLR